jgi:hypothetical protein
MQAFEWASSQPEPEASFLVRNVLLKVRDVALDGVLTDEHPSCTEAESLALIALTFPDVWAAWKAWVGPGWYTNDFRYFRRSCHCMLEAYLSVSLRTLNPRLTLDTITDAIRETYPECCARWLADDPLAVVHAAEKLVVDGFLTFDGSMVSAGKAVTADFLRARLNAMRDEAERLKKYGQHLREHREVLEASGCDTLAEYEKLTKQ